MPSSSSSSSSSSSDHQQMSSTAVADDVSIHLISIGASFYKSFYLYFFLFNSIQSSIHQITFHSVFIQFIHYKRPANQSTLNQASLSLSNSLSFS